MSTRVPRLVNLVHTTEESTKRPKIGDRVLAWVDGEWEVANYRGHQKGCYAWDFDTWGLSDTQVQHWRKLPKPPAENLEKGLA